MNKRNKPAWFLCAILLLCLNTQAANSWMRIESYSRYPALFTKHFTDSLYRAKKTSPAKNLCPILSGRLPISEKLVYSMGWGPVSAGFAFLIMHPDSAPGTIALAAKAATNDFFSTFFKIRDHFAMKVDSSGLYPFFFEQHINEGKYHAERWDLYNQHRSVVYSSRSNPDSVIVTPIIHNPFSYIYIMRTYTLAPGVTIRLNCDIGGKCVTVAMKCLKREKVSVPAGTFTCLVVTPSLFDNNGHVILHQEEVTLWLTDDAIKMPVLIQAKIAWGTVAAKLLYYEHKG